MKPLRHLLPAVAALVVTLPLGAQTGDPFVAMKTFSATQTVSAPGGRGVSGKIYRSGNQMRMDLPGGRGYSIVLIGSGDSYMVLNGNLCMHVKVPPTTMQAVLTAGKDAKVERTPAGSETIDGHPTTIEDLTITPANGQPAKYKVWEANDLHGFPLKMVTQTPRGETTVLYTEVSLSEPEASVFAKPDNCRDMAIPQIPGR